MGDRQIDEISRDSLHRWKSSESGTLSTKIVRINCMHVKRIV